MSFPPLTSQDIVTDLQIFTVIVGITLILRFAVKAWIHWASPYGFAPDRHWAMEDVLLLISYPVDVLHMAEIELGYVVSQISKRGSGLTRGSSHWGLGWHYGSLDPEEQVQSMKYGYISQPLGMLLYLDR